MCSTLKMWFHCPLIIIVFNEKSVVIIIFFICINLSLASFKIFLFITSFEQFMMCLGIVFFMFLVLGICWTSWIIIFIRFGKMLAIISANVFSLPSSPFQTPVTCIIGCLKLFYCLLMLFSFFKTFFPLCLILDHFYCYAFMFINLSYAVSNLSLVLCICIFCLKVILHVLSQTL